MRNKSSNENYVILYFNLVISFNILFKYMNLNTCNTYAERYNPRTDDQKKKICNTKEHLREPHFKTSGTCTPHLRDVCK